jgi:hypothetical protein
MSVDDDFAAFLRTLLPRGNFWRGPPAERFVDGIVAALGPVAAEIRSLPDTVAPFLAERPILLQWYEYLRKIDCVATPADTEDLRTRVLALLAAASTAFPAGLEQTVLAYLPLVEIDDLLPLSVLGWSTVADPSVFTIAAPCDPWSDVVEVWYPPLFVPVEQVLCVLRPFIPGVAVIRPVAPAALWYQPVLTNEAGAIALHWSQMRDATELVLERRTIVGDVLLETVTIDPVNVSGRVLASDLFPLLAPATDLTGQRLIAQWARVWAGQKSTLLVDTEISL